MIINHRYKFIFLKTRKTAGTSIEIALSKFSSNNDTITSISSEDELIRKGLGYTSPQNFYIALEHYNKSDWLRLLTRGKRRRFYNHAGATFIRNHVSDEIWNTYYKFCFERNPFDRAISLYYWKTEEPRPDISEFLLSVPAKRLSNWNTYTIGNEIAVDFVGRYEHLSGDLLTIASRLGLPGGISLPNAKSRFRKNRAPYGSLLNDEVRSRIERVCRNEIEAFNYNRG